MEIKNDKKAVLNLVNPVGNIPLISSNSLRYVLLVIAL